jgi:uncharacterized MAPEG superfamily protein
MSIELTALGLSAILGLIHVIAASRAASMRRGGKLWLAGVRDESDVSLGGTAGRLARAQTDFLETFPVFAAVVLTAHVSNRDSALTAWGAQMYFLGRLVYLPLYAVGAHWLRLVAWNVATAGIALVSLGLFVG